ncbi:MAG: glutamate 5-kinase [Lachnospiraceae bacterium]
MDLRKELKNKKRIVIKIGTSSLTHKETGRINLTKLEVLAREISDLRNQGKDVVLVSSGAIGVGTAALGLDKRPQELDVTQACAAVGQARLMMIYQKLFSEYNQIAGQVLMTKNTMVNNVNRFNAKNTFNAMLAKGVIPIVNENDTISTYEIAYGDNNEFGDNDTLSAIVAALIEADLLIMLTDIDGLYTDDPHKNADAEFISTVENLDTHIIEMGKGSTGSSVGTGGMATKMTAVQIASSAGTDVIIGSGKDFRILHRLIEGQEIGTFFPANRKDEFYLIDYIDKLL